MARNSTSMCNRIGKWHHGSEGCVQDHLLIIAATILTPVCQSETRLPVCLLPHHCELQRAGAGGGEMLVWQAMMEQTRHWSPTVSLLTAEAPARALQTRGLRLVS